MEERTSGGKRTASGGIEEKQEESGGSRNEGRRINSTLVVGTNAHGNKGIRQTVRLNQEGRRQDQPCTCVVHAH